MKDELKPCVWCGGEVIEEGGTVNYQKKVITLRVRCSGCGTKVQFRCRFEDNPRAEAIEAWNRRL